MLKTTVSFKKEFNFELKGDFYPADEANKPVIVYIHGGGLFWGSREDLKAEQIEFYHEAGYNIFSIDYRLAPETKISEIRTDIESALSWLENKGTHEFEYDPERIAVIGGSAGGYLALLSGLFNQKPKAIVSFYGYGDITGNWATKPSPHYQKMTAVPAELAKMLVSDQPISVGPIEKRYAIYMYARQSGNWIEQISGLHPVIFKDKLLQHCPAALANAEFPPTLLLHGTDDEDVPYEQSVVMQEKLQEAGVQSKLITIPGGKHVFDENWGNSDVQNAFKEVVQFLDQYL